MANGIYRITEEFEQRVAEYTGAPFAVAVDSCTSALFLCLKWKQLSGQIIQIPSHTYMSVPCAVINSGNYVEFYGSSRKLTGEYELGTTGIYDSALRFTSGMYRPGKLQCLSFSGPSKILKLSKGGMILTDDEEAYKWFKKARFVGRNEKSYHEDSFDMIGWNMYLLPELATRGLLLMEGMPDHNDDLSLPYPDLSQFPIYTKRN